MSSEQQVADLLKRWLKVEETLEERVIDGERTEVFDSKAWTNFKLHLTPADFVALANIAEWSKHGGLRQAK